MGEENKAVDVHVEEVGKFRYLGTVIVDGRNKRSSRMSGQ